jgi:hypothetical protein
VTFGRYFHRVQIAKTHPFLHSGGWKGCHLTRSADHGRSGSTAPPSYSSTLDAVLAAILHCSSYMHTDAYFPSCPSPSNAFTPSHWPAKFRLLPPKFSFFGNSFYGTRDKKFYKSASSIARTRFQVAVRKAEGGSCNNIDSEVVRFVTRCSWKCRLRS